MLGLTRSITLVATLLASGLGAAPAVAAAPTAPTVPTLNWTTCDTSFQCATAQVPLDYTQPDGPTISIAVMRHLATDPAHRLGTLFVNGGGPSEQLASFADQYTEVPASFRADYDVVDFDPRGFGYSSAVQCFATQSAERNFLAAVDQPFPYGPAQTATWDQTWTAFDATCAKTDAGNGLLRHDSTADVARDMDLLRKAVGDPVLNYFGVSYGTLLGSIYANLFPRTVGRMVLDGNVNAVAVTDEGGLPEFIRDGTAQASAKSLTVYLTDCGNASTTQCAFSAGSPSATQAKFSTLLSRLAAHPVNAPGIPPDCGYACAVGAVPLSSVAKWQQQASVLQTLWLDSTANTSSTSSAAEPQSSPPSSVYIGPEQNLAVLCSDGPEPQDPRAYTALAGPIADEYGPMGLKWLWPTEQCAGWPQGTDAYTGPWNKPTANTILLIGNTGDPDTAYAGSVAMSHHLGNARLLTVDGNGHTEISNPSACADAYERSYLLTGALPPTGTVCRQNINPFP